MLLRHMRYLNAKKLNLLLPLRGFETEKELQGKVGKCFTEAPFYLRILTQCPGNLCA